MRLKKQAKGSGSVSVCIFIASDIPLKEFAPSQKYSLAIDIDKGTVDDGGADDNFFLRPFGDVEEYTDKKYGVCLEWNYTEGRAYRIINYIKNVLQKTDKVEFWYVWLGGYHEYEDRPVVHRSYVAMSELTPAHIKEINDAEIFNTPDKKYPQRPSFYCLTITK